MRSRGLTGYLLVFIFPLTVASQAIDNTLSFRNIQSDHYFRINYENDFFTASDRDYTQGINVEWINPVLSNFLLTALLLKPRNSVAKYGLALENNAYTPNLIGESAIQYGDRPYAGVILVKTFLTAVNSSTRTRITSQLSTGLIGPLAGDEYIQKGIHQLISYRKPMGWHNQIKNDIAINYQVNYEKEWVKVKDHFSLSSVTSTRIGTLNTKVSAGVAAMLGKFYSPFEESNTPATRKFQFYLYDMPLVSAVAYDASLQGGLFNRSSIYTIPSKDLSRVTFVNRWGVVVVFRRLYIEYYQSGPTRDFTTSIYHRSGGLQVGFGF